MLLKEHDRKTDQGASARCPDSLWIERIGGAILEGDAEIAMSLVRAALEDGVEPIRIMKDAIVASMDAVGRDFKNGEFYIPDVLMSSRASQAALFAMSDSLEGFTHQPCGTVVVGTVAGDLHDIGKNITALLLECEGFKVIDLGIDVVPERFVEAVKEHKPDVVGLSALLTTTVVEMRYVVEALDRSGLREITRVYVSGLPVTQDFAESIGADHYCEDARDAIDYVTLIVKEKDHL